MTSGVRTNELVLNDLAVAPHARVAWDITGDRRTWLLASIHRRFDAELEPVARTLLATPITLSCKWDEAMQSFSKECTFGGGSNGTVGLPCGPDDVDPLGASCRSRLKMPRTWEQTLA